MTKKDFCKSWNVHTILNNGQTFCRLSKFSLKTVLLHNRNIHPSIPNAHSVHMKETHKNMDLLLTTISYSRYGCKICGDLHGIGLLLGIQSGYTKFCCFFFVNGTAEQKTNIPELRIGPCKKTQFQGKVCQKSTTSWHRSKCFEYLKEKFQKLSNAKLKEGIFIGLQIHASINNYLF